MEPYEESRDFFLVVRPFSRSLEMNDTPEPEPSMDTPYFFVNSSHGPEFVSERKHEDWRW